MRFAAAVIVAFGALGFAAAVPAGEGPAFKKVDLAALPANTWVEVGRETDQNKFLCSTWFLPAADEFFMWGRIGGAKEVFEKYDVETFDLRTCAWKSSFPKGKEESWSGGRFPNWTQEGRQYVDQMKFQLSVNTGTALLNLLETKHSRRELLGRSV